MSRRLPSFLMSKPLWQIDAAGAALVCLAAGVWYFAGVEPLSRVQAEHEAKEVELAMQREVSHVKAKFAATQERELNRLRDQIESSSIKLKRADALNAHVSALTTAAAEAGLRVDEMKPAAAMPNARFTVVPIRLSGGGSHTSIVAFFEKLRGSFGDTGVTGFELKRKESGANLVEGEEELRFVLNLVWYAAPSAASSKK